MKKILCIISGPTASGKTSTSIRLAKKFGGEIVNFDSLLFYKEISIGTAKPSLEERQGIPHHLIDVCSVNRPLNAANYSRIAIELINKLHRENKIVYLVGGSGFYLQAVLKGMYDSKTTPSEILSRSNKLYAKEGILPFREILKINDIESYHQYHENDHYRNRRAVEHYWANRTKFSSQREAMKEKLSQAPELVHGWNTFHIHLDLDKENHFKIIQSRTNSMLEEGLVDEVSKLLEEGYTGKEKPLQSIGYKEIFAYLNKNESKSLTTLDEVGERINISTRQLAKAQRTWFKKVQKMTFDPLSDKNRIETEFSLFLEKQSNKK